MNTKANEAYSLELFIDPKTNLDIFALKELKAQLESEFLRTPIDEAGFAPETLEVIKNALSPDAKVTGRIFLDPEFITSLNATFTDAQREDYHKVSTGLGFNFGELKKYALYIGAEIETGYLRPITDSLDWLQKHAVMSNSFGLLNDAINAVTKKYDVTTTNRDIFLGDSVLVSVSIPTSATLLQGGGKTVLDKSKAVVLQAFSEAATGLHKEAVEREVKAMTAQPNDRDTAEEFIRNWAANEPALKPISTRATTVETTTLLFAITYQGAKFFDEINSLDRMFKKAANMISGRTLTNQICEKLLHDPIDARGQSAAEVETPTHPWLKIDAMFAPK